MTIGSTGAVIKTSASERAVWQFRDESVIRMDTDTAIRVQPKPHNGNTIAHAVLQRGILWGRVIGHEMHAENNGIIAGVRGTSFMMKYGQGDIAVYHSRTPGNPLDLWVKDAANIVPVAGLSGKFHADAKLEYSPVTKKLKTTHFFGMNAVEYGVNISPDLTNPVAVLTDETPTTPSAGALDLTRVRHYAREDIAYMNHLIEQGNSRFTATLNDELAVTNAHVCATGEILWKEAKTPDKVCLAKGLQALINVESGKTKMYYLSNGILQE